MISGHVFRKCFGGWNLHNTAGWLSGSSPQSLYKSVSNREAEHQCGSFGIRIVSGNPCFKLLHQLCASSTIPHHFPWQRPILWRRFSPRHCQRWHHIWSLTNETLVLNDQWPENRPLSRYTFIVSDSICYRDADQNNPQIDAFWRQRLYWSCALKTELKRHKYDATAIIST